VIKLPIGIDDFSIANETYYVDKTLIIKDLIDSNIGKSILIKRPRRFGKSLTLSMIDYYFDIEKDSKKLFNDKLISKEDNKYKNYLNNYPVIHINMKNLSAESKESLISQTIDLISKIYRKYLFLLDDNLLDIEKKEFNEILDKTNDDIYSYTTALKNLSSLLEKHYNKKVIILIDEYDTPLDIAFQKKYYDEVILFFKKLYSATLKDNSSLLFSIVTGVLEVAKESIFSDLNNLNVLSVLNKNFSSYFGFTKEEVIKLLTDFNLKIDIKEIEKWYGGYGTNIEIYNPWSVLNLISNEMFDQYWVNTGSNNTLIELIGQIPNSIKMLNEAINNKSAIFRINNSITCKDVYNNFNALISYLVQTGYIVAKPLDIYGNYYLILPNLEISYTFEREIISRGINEEQYNLAKSLKNAILNSDISLISDLLKKYVLSSYSYYELNREKDYQVMLVGILAVLFENYIVKSEVIGQKGRCDILISPKNEDNGIVIELKKYKGRVASSRLKKFAEEALNQIIDKEYYLELKKKDVKNILLYSFIFDDNNVEILSKKI